jgi:uncharacterized protein YlxW (UPF0749 family)
MASQDSWHGGAVIVLGVAGVIIAAGISLADTEDVDVSRGTGLADLVQVETARVGELEQQVEQLAAEVDTLADQSVDDPVRQIQQVVSEQSGEAGFTELEGPGVTVTLDDAPVPDDLTGLPEGTSPDDYVVHQQDVEAVVNALWEGGAEGVSIMDRRLTSVSAVRCVGNVIILDGQVYSPPFVISAVGDPQRLTAALERSSGVSIYRQWADFIGLGWSLTERDSILLPAATGPSTLSHASTAVEQS